MTTSHSTAVLSRIGRTALLAVLVGWTLSLLRASPEGVVGSFMHLINLPFHEAGHVLFSPFGRFMTVLGGSLMQLLVPAVCAAALLLQQKDPFGAAVCVWWTGESLIDLAPYIDDARSLQLMLLGGPAAEIEGHDWEAILTTLGWLHLDHSLARAANVVGATLMAAGLTWAAGVLARQLRATS